MMIAGNGAVYVAFGAPYLAMALVSMVSLRATNPELPVCIITNVVPEHPDRDWWRPELGDHWLFLNEDTARNRSAKIGVYEYSPFDRTLYLDCDTMVFGDVSPIFTDLDYFDFAATPVYNPRHSKGRQRLLGGRFGYGDHGHFNSGVFAFRRSAGAKSLFETWDKRFRQLGTKYDQPSLLEAIYLSNARIRPLAAKWNSSDKWLTRERNEIVVWHYKARQEPLVESLMSKAVLWFGGTSEHRQETLEYIRRKRAQFWRRYVKWSVRRTVTMFRGYQSWRLKRNKVWARWTA